MVAIRHFVHQVDKAVEFYTKQLGFALKEDWGPVAVLSKDGIELWISGPSSSAGKTLVNGRKPEPGKSNRLVLRVENLQAKLSELKEVGVQPCSDWVKGPAGSWILVADPAGNAIELFQPK